MERCQEVEVLGTKENRPGREQEWVDTEPILTPGWGIHGLLLPQRKTQAQQQLRSPRYGKPLACPTFPLVSQGGPSSGDTEAALPTPGSRLSCFYSCVAAPRWLRLASQNWQRHTVQKLQAPDWRKKPLKAGG